MSKLFDLNGGVETSPLKETDGMYVVSTDANGQPVNSGFVTLAGLKANLDLGTAARADLTTSTSDTTDGRVLKVGDYGLGVGPGASEITQYNDIVVPGNYLMSATGASNNPPISGGGVGFLLNVTSASVGSSGVNNRITQEASTYGSSPRRYFRRSYTGTIWTPWDEYFHSNSIVPVENGGTNAMNAPDARANLGMGNVATRTVVTGNEDNTSTRIPTVGWVQANTVSVVEVPATPTSSGVAGQIAVDNTYAYFCTDTDTWIRVEKDNTWV